MKLLLFVTCLWHTTLIHRNTIKAVDLAERPKIGAKIHINGEVWKVVETSKVCSTPRQVVKAEAAE